MDPNGKYRPYLSYLPVPLKERTWPDREIKLAPKWCSVDLRDGNQALINPMTFDQKIEMFQLLVEIGFKEIEIGFPSAAAVEYNFTRALIEKSLIPNDVTPQVLVQCRNHLIDRTFEALQGAKQAIVHVYNSTSELQRRVVFKKEEQGIKKIAIEGVRRIKERALEVETEIFCEYSPESFTGTEMDFALDICEAVVETWQPSPERKMIINLPSTVEMSTPNVFADQIEWFARNISCRDSIILSIHPHNDRGTAVASAELALMAGADRVEGTLFGNGERTGNVDIVTLALNLFTQGVDSKLDFSQIEKIRAIAERLTELPVAERHPYAGDLVFTAFSGSHQDAINKGLKVRQKQKSSLWEVPYLPIDPKDIGRKYEAIIRINSQSGKGGIAYIMRSDFGCDLPKPMHPEFSDIIQKISDKTGEEVKSETIWKAFDSEFLNLHVPYHFVSFRSSSSENLGDQVDCELVIKVNGEEKLLKGTGNGPIDACKQALLFGGEPSFRIIDFSEHARTSGSDAEAVAFIQTETDTGEKYFGAGIHPNTITASIKALLSSLNRHRS